MRDERKGAVTKDMTVGDPIRLILSFAAPLLVGTIFQQVYSMVDTMEMGYLVGDDAISAIGAASALYNLLMSLIISMNNGFAIIVAQAFGARDEAGLRRSIAGTAVLNLGMAILVCVGSLLFLRPLLHFMNTPAAIFDQSLAYMLVVCSGLFATVGYNMFSSILRSVGNSRTPLFVLIVSSVANVLLDLFLIIVLDLGVVGTALGTVLAQTLSAVLCGRALWRDYPALLPRRADLRASRELWPRLLSSGTAMALMMCVVNLGTLIFQRANNVLGEDVIAAHAASRKIIEAFMQPLGTLATANSTFVSQNWGAEKYGRIRAALRKVMALEVLWGAVACAIAYLVARPLICLITGTQNAEIVANGVLAIRVSLPLFPVLGILLCLRTAMQAMGYKAAPVASSCVELAMKGVGAALLIPTYGYLGTSVTEPLTWVIMTAFLAAAYLLRRKRMFPATERVEGQLAGA